MAEYVTLKKPDGTVIYPQSVIAQVADGSITSDLLNISNISNYVSTDTVVPTSWTNKSSVTVVDAGTYFIAATVRFQCNELSSNMTGVARVTVGGTVPSSMPDAIGALVPGSLNYYASVVSPINGIVTIAANTTVALQISAGQSQNSKFVCNQASLLLIRLA